MKSAFNIFIILFSLIISFSFINSSCPTGSSSTDPILYKFLIVGDSINNEMPLVFELNGYACLIKNNNISTYMFESGTNNNIPPSVLGVEFSGQAVYNDDKYSILSYKFPSAVLTQDSSGLYTLKITNGKIWLQL